MSVNPGDKITYGLSLDFGAGWAKLSAEIVVQEGETVAEAVRRAETAIDPLLLAHVNQLKKVLLP